MTKARFAQTTTRWCNGSTGAFGALSHGSNPCRVANLVGATSIQRTQPDWASRGPPAAPIHLEICANAAPPLANRRAVSLFELRLPHATPFLTLCSDGFCGRNRTRKCSDLGKFEILDLLLKNLGYKQVRNSCCKAPGVQKQLHKAFFEFHKFLQAQDGNDKTLTRSEASRGRAERCAAHSRGKRGSHRRKVRPGSAFHKRRPRARRCKHAEVNDRSDRGRVRRLG